MNNDFKKSSYLLTILFFFIGIIALVGVSAAKYFSFDELVVTVSQIVSLIAFFAMFINCVYSKSKYNSACIRFADYILTNRRKEAERRTADAERMKEMQNIRAAAEREREKAVAAALQQGRSEGAQSAVDLQMQRQNAPVRQPAAMPQTASTAQPFPAPQVAASTAQPFPVPQQQTAPVQQRLPEQPRSIPEQRDIDIQPNEEVLYNEYGEPVMMRRRVRKAHSPDGELLYDSQGNPVIRRNQGLWEPIEQRHEFVFKFETSPGVTVSQPDRSNPSERREGDQ